MLPEGSLPCVHLSSQSTLFNRVPVINVPTPTNKRYTGYPDDRSLMEKPSDEKVIRIGPATLNDETDVRMAFRMIQEATASFLVIHIISDTTGILLIVICPSYALS